MFLKIEIKTLFLQKILNKNNAVSKQGYTFIYLKWER